MKYIRTKNGHIYKIVNTDFFGAIECEYYNITKYVQPIDILNQADTIEELCDEFVVVVGKEPNSYLILNQCMNNFEKVVSIHKNTENENTIYGAIWTGKGLIYVAKMNEKGELELL